MRLCLTSHVAVYRHQEAYVCQSAFCKLVQEVIAPMCTRLDLCLPLDPGPPPANFTRIHADNITVCPLPAYYSKWEAAALYQPRRLLKSLWPHFRRADAVCIAVPNYLGVLAWIACLLQSKRYMMVVVGDLAKQVQLAFERKHIPVAGQVMYGVHHLVTHAMVRTSTATLTTGQAMADMYGRHCARVMPFIDSTFHDEDLAPDIAQSGKAERIVLCVGRIDMGKGLRELVLAARDLVREGLPLRVRIVGEGPHRDQLERLIRELGIEGQVDMVGWVALGPALVREYRTADVMVLASYSEGSPKVVGEAMANGLPVIATRVGSVPEVVVNGRTGLIVPIRDAGALRDALRTVLADEPRRQGMAAASLARARLYTIEAAQRTISKALRRLGPAC
jgi:glycosyltransferase involved in cell wall biosynthesis